MFRFQSVRVQFEIGHEASVRTKKTPEGFTHDWEVFVRGADNTDIQCFVDKVVFHLHETFPKPRRVIKEPPYLVKESGYAGFVLPIDVYLKNKEEPKKISFQYDLQLQPSGPPISRVLREPRLFQNPSEDFRRKLIRGGGVGVDTPAESHVDDSKLLGSLGGNKSKISESPIKKHKPDPPPNDSFAELFGTPIRRVLDSKKLSDVPKKLTDLDLLKNKKKTLKYGSYKNETDSVNEKEKKLDKERIKDREKNKDRIKKRPLSPLLPVLQPLKYKDEHKKQEERRREEHEERKRKKEEKEKREKTKEVKDITKLFEKESKKDKRESKETEHVKKVIVNKPYEVIKPNYEKHSNGSAERDKEKDKEKHRHRHKKKERDKNKNKEKHRKEKNKGEKEPRDREKEKLSKKKHEESREKDEKIQRISRSPGPIKKKPLNALLDELGSSDSASQLSEDGTPPTLKSLSKAQPKIVPETKTQQMIGINTAKIQSTNMNMHVLSENRIEKEIDQPSAGTMGMKSRKDKSSNKKNRKRNRQTERRSITGETPGVSSSSEGGENEEDYEDDDDEGNEGTKEDEDEVEDDGVEDGLEKNKPVREGRERTDKEEPNDQKLKLTRERENKKRKRDKGEDKYQKTKQTGNSEKSTPASESFRTVDIEDGIANIRKTDKFTKEYVAQLRELQHRIMSLENNAELQKVVKVIAETGQYEITKKTFDFDLCALDLETVKRLQEFFLPT
ncbi:hypothetical protein RUM44_005793 [Polyplax serrata]|uniref:YEATS domain-containing protein n=1 Tax=Polyplax serrata TaxID=468196 RepID=A0ABR1AY32_POLSC